MHFCFGSHHVYPVDGMHPCLSTSPPTIWSGVGVDVGAGDDEDDAGDNEPEEEAVCGDDLITDSEECESDNDCLE